MLFNVDFFLLHVDWMSFQGLIGERKPKGDPEGECLGCPIKYWGDPELSTTNWEYGTLKDTPSPHMICDLNGIGLKWSEVKDGMLVKIKARNIHRKDGDPLYEYLYSAEGRNGKYFNQKQFTVGLINYMKIFF